MSQITTEAAKPISRNEIIKNFLAQQESKLRDVATTYLTPERAIRLFCTQIVKTPRLADCDPVSILKCLIDAVSMGVEPGREAHFIPRAKKEKQNNQWVTVGYECTLIVDYKGLLAIMLRSENILKVEAEVVYVDDLFVHHKGDDAKIEHVPNYKSERRGLADITNCYAIAKLANGERVRDVLTLSDIKAIRDMGSNADGDVWTDPYTATEMVRKTAVRRLFKYLPFPVEIKDTIERMDRNEYDPPRRQVDSKVTPTSIKELPGGQMVDIDFAQPGAPDDVPVVQRAGPAAAVAAAAVAKRQQVDAPPPASVSPAPPTQTQAASVRTAVGGPPQQRPPTGPSVAPGASRTQPASIPAKVVGTPQRGGKPPQQAPQQFTLPAGTFAQSMDDDLKAPGEVQVTESDIPF